jgi:hypothetical protein
MSPSHEDQLAKTRSGKGVGMGLTSPRGQPGLVSDTCGFRAYCGGEAGGGMHMYPQTSLKETLYMLPGKDGMAHNFSPHKPLHQLWSSSGMPMILSILSVF